MYLTGYTRRAILGKGESTFRNPKIINMQGEHAVATRLQFALNVPSALSRRLKAEVAKESRVQTVLALFKRDACSAGVAAKMLGLSVHDFLDFLKQHDVPYAHGSAAATAADRRSLTWMRKQSGTPHARRR